MTPDTLWFKCPHCSAMFKSASNECHQCGAPADLWDKEDGRMEFNLLSSMSGASCSVIMSTATTYGVKSWVEYRDTTDWVEEEDDYEEEEDIKPWTVRAFERIKDIVFA